MFRLLINETDHGTFDTVSAALEYVERSIEDGDLETVHAKELSIHILK